MQKQYFEQDDVEAGAQARQQEKEDNHFASGAGGVVLGNGPVKEQKSSIGSGGDVSAVKLPPPPGFVPTLETYAPAGYVYTQGATATKVLLPPTEHAMDR